MSMRRGFTIPMRYLGAIVLLSACGSERATDPAARLAPSEASLDQSAVASTSLPSGQRVFGKATVEPAYDDVTGSIVYLLTPDKVPIPAKSNPRAWAPLYLVEYPPGTALTTFNCAGVPGNCPDHDADVAGAATSIMPSVYGTNPAAVPGHDHLVATPGSGGDFNVAWNVVEVLFTNRAAANTRITTEAQLDAAVARGDAIEVDLGFAFNCSVVPANVYWKATPIG